MEVELFTGLEFYQHLARNTGLAGGLLAQVRVLFKGGKFPVRIGDKQGILEYRGS